MGCSPVLFCVVQFAVLLCIFVHLSDCSRSHTNRNHTSCHHVKNTFILKRIAKEEDIPLHMISGSSLPLCESRWSCCTQSIVEHLPSVAHRDLVNLVRHKTGSLRGMFDSHAVKLQDYILRMLHLSENNTNIVLATNYRRPARHTRSTVAELYRDMTAFLHGRETGLDVQAAVKKFFDNLFPIVYQHVLKPKGEHFNEEFIQCLRENREHFRPFGQIPTSVSYSLSKSFDATRSVIQALHFGIEVLNTTGFYGFSSECQTAMLKMNYCPRCRGLTDARPCRNYCQNVLRGCMAPLTELDNNWNYFLVGLERLALSLEGMLDIEENVAILDSKISDAIMYAMENGPWLERQVNHACNQYRRTRRDVSDDDGVDDTVDLADLEALPLKMKHSEYFVDKLKLLVSELVKSRGFYMDFGDSVCLNDDFSVRDNENCWNGHSIGGYNDIIVGQSLSAQKYNPEMRVPQHAGHNMPHLSDIYALNDKLDHVTKTLNSKLTRRELVGGRNMMRFNDQEGSGDLYDDDDCDYASGSGEGSGCQPPSTIPPSFDPYIPTVSGPSSGCSNPLPSSSLLPIILILATTCWVNG